jgi:hypothetical protein
MNYTLVAVGKDIFAFPYLYKLSNILTDLGELEYVHWDRSSKEDNVEQLDHIIYKKMIGFCPTNKVSLLIGYVLWFFSLLKFFLFNADTTRLYFVSRLDAAGPLMLASLVRPSIKYVYLDRDAYHMTYKLGVFKGFVKKIETIVASRSVFHFIPGVSRNFKNNENVRVIENTPNKKFLLEAETQRSEKFIIYVNGWLVDTRGAQAILKCANNLDKDKYQVIVAGPTQCVAIKELVKLPVVNYLGQLSNIDSLSYYFISDVVLSFYDPSIEINRKAEPNKWYDCAFTNTPFVSNYGIQTADPFVKSGLCHLINYDDDRALLQLVNKMRCNRNSLDKTRRAELLKNLGIDSDFEFKLIGHSKLDYINFFGIDIEKKLNLSVEGFVNKSSIDSYIQEASIILNLGNLHDEQIPSKIVDLIFSGKPVIHIYQSKSDASLGWLKANPIALCIHIDELNTCTITDVINNFIDGLCDFNLCSEYKEFARKAINDFSIKKIAKQYVQNVD